jgi:hypothetical protein
MDLRTKRVLAVDLRSRSFGFVVFEGPDQPLDWGVKIFRNIGGRKVPAGAKLLPLLIEFHPTVVLLRSTVWKAPKTRHQLRSVLNRIQRRSDRIAIRLISPQRIGRTFDDPLRNKNVLAARVAARFPDLAWKLPPQRRFPYREHYRMSIFDAAALALAYYRPSAGESQARAVSTKPSQTLPTASPRHSSRQ